MVFSDLQNIVFNSKVAVYYAMSGAVFPLHFAYIFQLSSHDKLVNSKTFHIQLFIHIQSFLAKEIKECQQNLRVIIIFFSKCIQVYSVLLILYCSLYRTKI